MLKTTKRTTPIIINGLRGRDNAVPLSNLYFFKSSFYENDDCFFIFALL